jgi:hypothetical protein
MDLILTILAGLGAILFIIGYLGFVTAGFKHHFVTGIISSLPILNIVTIPALWRNANWKLIMSTFGLVLIIASWFLGANNGIQKLFTLVKGDNISSSVPFVNSKPSPTNITSTIIASPVGTKTIKPYVNQQRVVDESNMQALPKKALYKISFEKIPLDKIHTLLNNVVQIIRYDNQQLEGKVIKITTSSLFIKNNNALENELPIANIKRISLMVKKAN